MFSFLKASPPAPRIDSSRTDAEYRKLRWQVFAGVFIGYAAYYLIRKNFSLAIPYLIDEYGFTKADLGTVGVALSLAYGFSKFIMGMCPTVVIRSILLPSVCWGLRQSA